MFSLGFFTRKSAPAQLTPWLCMLPLSRLSLRFLLPASMLSEQMSLLDPVAPVRSGLRLVWFPAHHLGTPSFGAHGGRDGRHRLHAECCSG